MPSQFCFHREHSLFHEQDQTNLNNISRMGNHNPYIFMKFGRRVDDSFVLENLSLPHQNLLDGRIY